jgi:hypothetical protein
MTNAIEYSAVAAVILVLPSAAIVYAGKVRTSFPMLSSPARTDRQTTPRRGLKHMWKVLFYIASGNGDYAPPK